MYRDKLDEIMYSVNNKAISTKILQHMAKIRNNDDEGQARRFVWELIQNAKDVAQENIPLSIRITHDLDKLVFAHNGKNFRLKNILSLINQVSGKSDDSKTTGKFGTGFITTHLLAEKVTVRGVLEDFGLEPKAFEVLIDRSGKDDDEVIAAVDSAMDSLRGIDEKCLSEYDSAALNTQFEYHLETDYSRKVADIGINDAAANLFYCMAFVPQIHELILDDRILGTVTTYCRGSAEHGGGNVSRLIITCDGVPHQVVTASDGEVMTAVMVDDDNCIVPITEKSSRLFCDFPLIDVVTFPFPAVVNSSAFRVNEPRSCITLTDNPNSTDSEINKRLMCNAVRLYDSLLGYLVQNGCGKLYNMVYTPAVFSRSDISEQWVKDNIIAKIAECVADKPIFRSRQGVFSAKGNNLRIPDPAYPEMVEDMNELLYGLNYHIIEEDTLRWANVLADFNSDLFCVKNVKNLLDLTNAAETVAALRKTITQMGIYDWFKRLYLCAVKDEDIRNEINVGKYKIIPVQNGVLRQINEVYSESVVIDSYFKDISEAIDRYVKSDEKLYLRSILADNSLDISCYDGIPEFELSRLEHQLKHGTRNSLNSTEVPAVRRRLAACIADDRAYEIYRTVDTRVPTRYTPTLKLPSAVWDNTLIAMEEAICSYFRYYNGKRILFKNEEEKLHWIDIINYYYEVKGRFDTLAYKEGPIITEQLNGNCCLHMISFNQAGFAKIQDIDDLMISIYQQIVPDGIKLIDRRIKLDRSMVVDVMNEFKAATLVSNRITAELDDGALHTKAREFQAACSQLLRWINQHEDRAKELFPAFYSKEKRMQLLTAEQAAEMSDSLDAYESMMKKYGFCSVEELEQKLTEVKHNIDTVDETNDIPEEYYGLGYSDTAGNFDEITKLVGELGEKMAVKILQKKYGDNATVTLYNSESHKQQGYDITVTIPGQQTLYYEVKTRTASSKFRHCLNFSRSQARRLHEKDYHVLLVVIDGQKQLVEHMDFDDMFECFAGGNFIRSDGYSIVTK